MSTHPTTERTIEVPGCSLHYELRGGGPTLVFVGSPMDASSFAPIADLLADSYSVITLDPRGINRSGLTAPAQASTPELRASDLASILDAEGVEASTVFGSSGGAVTALALALLRPELVTRVIAHEPPLANLLDDAAEVRASTDEMIAAYLAGDVVGAWQLFFDQAGIDAPPGLIAEWFGGERDPQVVADELYWFAHELRESTFWNPDLERLRTSPVDIVLGIGEQSTGQLCDRTTTALATAIERPVTRFSGDHTGFVDSPEDFAVRLREILSAVPRRE